jgi:2-oxo-4-hydroxy-4-carboxy--5-ureidoimidazoline (OHCU) decarboxylase
LLATGCGVACNYLLSSLAPKYSVPIGFACSNITMDLTLAGTTYLMRTEENGKVSPEISDRSRLAGGSRSGSNSTTDAAAPVMPVQPKLTPAMQQAHKDCLEAERKLRDLENYEQQLMNFIGAHPDLAEECNKAWQTDENVVKLDVKSSEKLEEHNYIKRLGQVNQKIIIKEAQKNEFIVLLERKPEIAGKFAVYLKKYAVVDREQNAKASSVVIEEES